MSVSLMLLLAAPVWAQRPTCKVSHPATGEIWVQCGDVEIGQREDPNGERFELKKERSWQTLGVKVKKEKKIKTADFPRELDPLVAALPSGAAPVLDVPISDAQVVHDVTIYWTDRAEAAQGGPDAMRALTTLSVAVANQTYANSLVPLTLRLVDMRRVAFVETASAIGSDLGVLQGKAVVDRNGVPDTRLDEVHTLRDQYGADIVTLIGDGYAAAGACGVGYMFNGSPTLAFNVVDRTCAVGRPSYGHEVGHNQGLHHNPENAPVVAGAYNYGHTFGALGSMMSYLGSRVRYLSNPNVIHPNNGLPTGIAGQRDNARRLRETMAAVAAFRTAPTSRPPSAVIKPHAKQ